MSEVTLLKIASTHCTSTDLFVRYGNETNLVYSEFLEQLMSEYRKSNLYQYQTMKGKIDDEFHFQSLRQFILNLQTLSHR